MTFEALYPYHKQFVEKVFEKATAESCLTHLKKEIAELEAEKENDDRYDELIELSDCFLCLLSYAAKRGYTAKQIVFGLESKVEINVNRTWKFNPEDGTYSHVKKEPCTKQ